MDQQVFYNAEEDLRNLKRELKNKMSFKAEKLIEQIQTAIADEAVLQLESGLKSLKELMKEKNYKKNDDISNAYQHGFEELKKLQRKN